MSSRYKLIKFRNIINEVGQYKMYGPKYSFWRGNRLARKRVNGDTVIINTTPKFLPTTKPCQSERLIISAFPSSVVWNKAPNSMPHNDITSNWLLDGIKRLKPGGKRNKYVRKLSVVSTESNGSDGGDGMGSAVLRVAHTTINNISNTINGLEGNESPADVVVQVLGGLMEPTEIDQCKHTISVMCKSLQLFAYKDGQLCKVCSSCHNLIIPRRYDSVG